MRLKNYIRLLLFVLINMFIKIKEELNDSI